MVDLIEDKNTDDLSQQLIKLGLAKFKSFDNPYLVPAYIECRLLNAQEKAQNAKLGIWAKINNER